MPIKIGIIGPESSGKSSLAKSLSTIYKEPFVEEYAREYLSNKTGYIQKDLDHILQGQIDLENKQLTNANKFLFCDTTPLVIEVWSNYKYGNCSESIRTASRKIEYDLHFICAPDLPYEKDPLRENPDMNERESIFNLYKINLKERELDFEIITGLGEQRIKSAIKLLASYFPD